MSNKNEGSVQKPITIRIEIEGKLKEKLLRVKEERGVKTNTELVRVLIMEEARRCQS